MKKKEWDKRNKEKGTSQHARASSERPPRQSGDGRTPARKPQPTVVGTENQFKPICAQFMLGKCNKTDWPKHHPRALAAKISKTVDRSLAQGTNLFKGAPVAGDAENVDQPSAATPNAKAKVKATAKPKR